jgi:hypothetical protein
MAAMAAAGAGNSRRAVMTLRVSSLNRSAPVLGEGLFSLLILDPPNRAHPGPLLARPNNACGWRGARAFSRQRGSRNITLMTPRSSEGENRRHPVRVTKRRFDTCWYTPPEPATAAGGSDQRVACGRT